MATTQSLLPQQGPQETVTNIPQAVPTNNNQGYSSGSIGPFFAVISVLTVLAVLSCFLGRICTGQGREVTQLESIGCWGWLKRRCRKCIAGDVEVGEKVMTVGDERNEAKTKDGDQDQQPRAS